MSASWLSGHMRYYAHRVSNGHGCIQMGTTGGMQESHPPGPGTMDHLQWVTMTWQGSEIANIRLEGLLDRCGAEGRTAP